MSITLKTPGVYITEKPLLPPSIVQVSTAIPAFFGYTEISPSEPVRISSMKEFETSFGDAYEHKYNITLNTNSLPPTVSVALGKAFGTYFFYEAIQLYFANGGGPCYIISVGKHIDTITAGNFVTELEELEKLDEPTIVSFPEAANLSLGDYKKVTDKAFLICNDLKDKFILIDTPKTIDLTDQGATGDLINFRSQLTATNPSYGAAYFPHLEVTTNYQISDSSKYENVTLKDLKDNGNANYQVAVNILNELGKVTLPPSSLIAGVYANVDRASGVWKAPANIALQGVVKPTVAISDSKQAKLNIDADTGKSINAIRTFAGKGTVIWGARTLDGNSNEWRYIPVRRLFMTAEESIKKATTQFVFEPNDSNTWVKVNSMINSYLNGLWKEGALAGATAKDAYFVNVGLGVTMTTQDILEGKMIIQVGLAAVRPAEFIVLQFSHFMNQ